MKRGWGVAIRDFHVRLLECSPSGCLLESSLWLEPGTTARLRLAIDRHHYIERVEIVRCQAIAGTSSYHVGARFLPTAAPANTSLRLALRRAAPAGLTVISQGNDRDASRKSGRDQSSVLTSRSTRARESQ
jgi:hypothetical protein